MNFKFNESDEYKQKIVNLIKKNNPKDSSINKYATWIENPEDIKDSYLQAVVDDETIETGITPDFTKKDIKKALESNHIVVYSSKPIKIGSFVTPSKMLAQSYGNDDPYSKEVTLDEVAWIASDEGQYVGSEITEDLVYYNNNPRDENIGDCSIRSIALATGKDYNKIRHELTTEAQRIKREAGIDVEFNSLLTIKNVLIKNHFEQVPVPVKGMKCKDVVKHVPYVAVMVILEPIGHAVCSAGGHLYDTWDSSNALVAHLFINKRSKEVNIEDDKR